jgi:hypothetical protein
MGGLRLIGIADHRDGLLNVDLGSAAAVLVQVEE